MTKYWVVSLPTTYHYYIGQKIFNVDAVEHKLPAVLAIQIWDNDTLTADDFIGTFHHLILDCHCVTRRALNMLGIV